jgi:hypothetical protein
MSSHQKPQPRPEIGSATLQLSRIFGALLRFRWCLALAGFVAIQSRRVATNVVTLVAAIALLSPGLAPRTDGAVASSDATELDRSSHDLTTQGQRLVAPVGTLADCEQSIIKDVAEEVEAELLPACHRDGQLRIPTCTARELFCSRNNYVARGLQDWLREHHAPRGPPAV